MRWWGIRVVALALASVVAASCNDGVEVGDAPTTTAEVSTTLPETAPTTTTSKPARKATTKTTARTGPKPTLPPPEQQIEIKPEHVEPFLLDQVATWFRVPDDVSQAGPLDLARAADDAAAGDGEAAAEIRKLLDRFGFLAGYSRRWDKAEESRRNATTSVTVALLLFRNPQGSDAYRDFRVDVFKDAEGLEEMYVGDIPGARGWIGGTREDGYGAVIVCELDGFYFEVVAETEAGANDEHRRAAQELARAQHERLRNAFE